MLLKPLKNIYKLVRSWVCTVLVFLLFMYIIRVSQIFENYISVLSSPNIGFTDKLERIVDPVLQLFNYNDGFNFNSLLIIIVSLFEGIIITLMFYIKLWKRKELEMLATCPVNFGASTGVTSTAGAVISFFGVGCVPCKTVLISPLVALIFAGGGPIAFATSILMDAILIISVILCIYAISKMLYTLVELYYPDLIKDKSKSKDDESKEEPEVVDNRTKKMMTKEKINER